MHLERLLGSLLMPDLTQERITSYMADRKAERASNRTINLELSVLSRAIGHPFRLLWPKLKRLKENHDLGRALSMDEETRLLEAARKNRSRLIEPFVCIALLTGMRRDEIRLLRWRQIDFQRKCITVGEAKTEAGSGREINFGPKLEAILTMHMAWYAARFGPVRPDWHVFPFCQRARPSDPTRPVTSLKKAWGSVCDAAGVQCRIHDLRHTACTKMAEAGVPEATMLAIMGHMSRKMLERYSHIRQEARIEAMNAVESRSAVSVMVAKDSAKVGQNSVQ